MSRAKRYQLRPSDFGPGLAVFDNEAARIADDGGLTVVINRCPKIERLRPCCKPRLNLKI